MTEIYTKLLILGSGPAGCTAAIYAARANLAPIMLMGMELGGQLATTTDVENYPGFIDGVKGPWLMDQMLLQAQKFGTSVYYEQANYVNFDTSPFIVNTSNNTVFYCNSVIICTGAIVKWIGLPSENEFKGFGVSGCATCDGFFFKNKNVLVIGGGNTAVEEALHLTNYANEVTLMHRNNTLRGEKIMQKKLFNNPKIKIIWNHELEEVIGANNPKIVNAAKIKDTLTNKTTTLNVDGIFVAIGHKPNTELFKKFISIDKDGYIITSPNSTKTNIPGVFAAGDVQDRIFRQAITSAATGCMAALEVEKFLANTFKS